MQRKKNLQNRIAESRYSLPLAATLIVMIWVAVGLMAEDVVALGLSFGLVVVSTYLMVLLNNFNSLMRTYSRMVSCSFLVLITMAGLPVPGLAASIVTPCIIAFYLFLWQSYQDRFAAGTTFFAFFFLGLGSMAFAELLYLVPVMWVVMASFTLSFSVRTLFASLIGVVAPYWFALAWYASHGQIADLIGHFALLADVHPLTNYGQLTDHQLVNLGFIGLLAVIGIVHFLHTSYADKIRTRLVYESFILVDAATAVLIGLQPQYVREWGVVLIVTSSPLIAHVITYTRGKVPNIMFITALCLVAFILCYNLFVPEAQLFIGADNQ